MEPLDVVEQVHHLELRERDAQLEQRFGEASAQDPVDASFGIDQPTGGGSLPLNDIFIPRGGDIGSRTPLRSRRPRSAPTVRVLSDSTCCSVDRTLTPALERVVIPSAGEAPLHSP